MRLKFSTTLILLAVLAGMTHPLYARFPALTNKAQAFVGGMSGTNQFASIITNVFTNYFKFDFYSMGVDPANPNPQPGDTIHIPIWIQNVGSIDMVSALSDFAW